jgi:hypothetical protein
MTRTDGLGSQQPVKPQEFNACSGGILQQTSLAIVRRQLKTELVVREHPTGLGLPNREPLQTFFSCPRANGVPRQEVRSRSSEIGQALKGAGVNLKHQAVQM